MINVVTLRGVRCLFASCALLHACAPRARVSEHEQVSGQAPKPAPSSTAAAPPTGASELPGGSLYNLKAALVDHQGRTQRLDTFRGHPVLISMFYTSCTTMCPLLISNLQRVDQALPPRVRAETRVLLVSLDPYRDTPSKLTSLAAERQIDLSRWSLVSTSADSVRELAAVLDVRYRRLPNGDYVHSSVVTLLDGSGVPRKRVEERLEDPHELVQALSAVVGGGAAAAANTRARYPVRREY